MKKETKANFKIAIIALLILGGIAFTLKTCESAHEEAHRSGKEHAH